VVTLIKQAAARVSRQLQDAFMLKRSEAVVRGYAPAQQAMIRRLYATAMNRIAWTDDTTDARYAAAAVAMHRETVRFLISAVLLSRDATLEGAPLELGAGARKLEELVQAGALPALPEDYAEAMAMLDTPDVLALDRLAPRKAADRRATVETLVHWLRGQIEARSLTGIWVARVVRLTLAGVVVLGLTVWGLGVMLAPENLALHKSVTMSSRHVGTPSPEGATDGKVVSPYQAHTAIEANPWIEVDLGAVRRISKVKIRNRTDGHASGALPLTLEFSDNDKDYHTVDYRNEAFTSSDPWVFTTRTASARFVRIHGHQGGYVVVTEIEVYGR
jgi:hypothetical protein